MPKLNGATRRLLVALVVVATSMILMVGSALAHENREVGEYELTVGFSEEPAIVEEPNGLFLRVQRGTGDDGEPVEGLAGSLEAEIIYGAQRLPLEIEPAFGSPGEYTADVIPTAAGAYTFRIFGSIEGLEIDESFTSGPDTFSEVTSRQSLTFPNQVGTVGDVQTTADDASDSASTAMLLGIAGLAFGVVGTLIGVTAFMRSSGRRTEERS